MWGSQRLLCLVLSNTVQYISDSRAVCDNQPHNLNTYNVIRKTIFNIGWKSARVQSYITPRLDIVDGRQDAEITPEKTSSIFLQHSQHNIKKREKEKKMADLKTLPREQLLQTAGNSILLER